MLKCIIRSILTYLGYDMVVFQHGDGRMNARVLLTTVCTFLILLFSALMPVSFAVADPILLHETGRLTSSPYPGLVHQITIDDNYIYVSLDDGGFEIRDKTTGIQLDQIRPGLDAYAIQFQIRDNYAFVADWNRFTVLDISDKNNIVEVGGWNDWPHDDNDYFALGTALQGDYCFLSILNYGIVTLDVSDPHAPVNTGFLPEPENEEGKGVRISTLYLLNQPNRLLAASYRGSYVYDISDPNDLTLTESVPSYPTSRVVCDPVNELMYVGFAYVSSTMFKVYDISDPDSIVHLQTYGDPLPEGEQYSIRGFYRYGDYLFVTDGYREVHVLDYSDPENPEKVASFPLPPDVNRFMSGFAIDGHTAYVGTGLSGIIMVDVSPLGIPEPGTLLLASTGILGVVMAVRRRKRP